jgi:hypothetical protein
MGAWLKSGTCIGFLLDRGLSRSLLNLARQASKDKIYLLLRVRDGFNSYSGSTSVTQRRARRPPPSAADGLDRTRRHAEIAADHYRLNCNAAKCHL